LFFVLNELLRDLISISYFIDRCVELLWNLSQGRNTTTTQIMSLQLSREEEAEELLDLCYILVLKFLSVVNAVRL